MRQRRLASKGLTGEHKVKRNMDYTDEGEDKKNNIKITTTFATRRAVEEDNNPSKTVGAPRADIDRPNFTVAFRAIQKRSF